jgi:hypothetical protein
MATRSISLVAATALFVACIGAGGASAAKPHPSQHKASTNGPKDAGTKRQSRRNKVREAAERLPSGIYDNCALPTDGMGDPAACATRLKMIRQGGFRVVLNYGTGSMSVADNLAYANLARRNGLQVVWNLADFREMTFEEKVELVLNTRSHPATWGYYIGDEVLPEDREAADILAEAVHGLTRRPLLYVSRPNPALLRPFRDIADVAGPDVYPVGPIDPPVCRTARWASRTVKGRFAMVLQAYSWSIVYDHFAPRWPSAKQMRKMRDDAIRCSHRPPTLFWFCFHCIADFHPHPAAYWRQVAWAANGVRLPHVGWTAQAY